MAEQSLKPGVEILMDASLTRRARRFLQAMADAYSGPMVTTRGYHGRNQLLMLYGPGSPMKLPMVKRHKQAGGRVVMWDLGYWDRERSMRLAIDAMHPTSVQIAASPTEQRREFVLRNDADPAGPILLIGMGAKSTYAYGYKRAQEWERRKLAELRQRFPGREILWRPKGRKDVPLDRLRLAHNMPIEDAMRGCSLVVCHHSNVAVDACVAGIPVECEGGAAVSLYAGNPSPDESSRADFLTRLSWWEWAQEDAGQAWQWIERVTS